MRLLRYNGLNLGLRRQTFESLIKYYSINSVKPVTDYEQPLIVCKRAHLNFYRSNAIEKFNNIQLASKGWAHTKSKNDYFIVNPIIDEYEEERKPFCHITNNILADCLRKENIYNATAFQEKVVNCIKSDKNVLFSGETGCGKTVAYLLPIIEKVMVNRSSTLNTPKALILIPSRELAFQVGKVAEKLCEAVNLKVKIFVGGRTKKIIMNPEFSEFDILVGTPGVISKLSTVGIVKLDSVLHTVIDEADTLLDDSFIDRMQLLLKRVIQSQLILVSATLPKKLPDYLSPLESELVHVISPKIHMPLFNVKQRFLRLTKSTKPPELLNIAKKIKDPMIIFSNKNETCNWVALFLRENGINCSNINGNMNYEIRINQWNDFVKGDNKILSATDVGSRGLNTIQVTYVLNYDFPLYASDYIHRVGRTGRFGSPNNCQITNFISGVREIQLVQEIETAVRTNTPIPNVDGNITSIVQNNIRRNIK